MWNGTSQAIKEYKYGINLISQVTGFKQNIIEQFLFGEQSGVYGPAITGEEPTMNDFVGATTDLIYQIYQAKVLKGRAERAAVGYLMYANSDFQYMMSPNAVTRYFTEDLLARRANEVNALGPYAIFVPEYVTGYEQRIDEIVGVINHTRQYELNYIPSNEEVKEFMGTF